MSTRMATESNISDSDRDDDRDEEDNEDDYLDSSDEDDDNIDSPVVGTSSQQRGFSDTAQQRSGRPSLPPISLTGSGTTSHTIPTGVSRMGIPKIPLLNTPAEAGSRSSPAVPSLALPQSRPSLETNTEAEQEQQQQQHTHRALAPPQARDSTNLGSDSPAVATAAAAETVTCHLLSPFELQTGSRSVSGSAALQQAAQQLGVASSQVILYELHPVAAGSTIPAGRQIAASVRGSTFTMKELEDLLAENMRLRTQVEQLEAGSRMQPSTSEQPASQALETRSSQTVHQALQERVNECQAWLETERDRHRTESEQMHGQYNSLREQYDQLLADVRAFATPAATPPPLGTGRGPRTFDAIPLLDDDSSIHDFPARAHNASFGPRTSTFRVGEVVMNGPTTPHAVTSSPRGDYEDIQPREPGQNGLRVDGRGLGGGDPAGLEHLISALHTLTVNNRAERLASVVQRLCDNDVLMRLERGLGVTPDP